MAALQLPERRCKRSSSSTSALDLRWSIVCAVLLFTASIAATTAQFEFPRVSKDSWTQTRDEAAKKRGSVGAAKAGDHSTSRIAQRNPDKERWDLSREMALILESMRCVPNPAGAATAVELKLLQDIHIEIEVFSARGASMRRLVNDWHPQGIHQIHLATEDLQSGLYLVQLSCAYGRATAPLVVKH